MDLSKILSFKAVADAGSISRATGVVHLSQPALSLQIQALEFELGVKLFERHNRGLILTEEGKLLRERAILLSDWVSETNSLMSGLRSLAGGIRIGTYTTASSYLLAPRLKNFFKEFPKIELKYQYLPTLQILAGLRSLDLDCAIISEVPEVNGIRAIPFFRSELILVCSAKNKSIPTALTPVDLKDFPFLSYPLRLDHCYREVERKFGKYLTTAPVPIESESFDTLKQSLLSDLGITFMPEYLVTSELKEKKIRRISLSSVRLPITFSLVLKKDKKLSPRLEAFKDYLMKTFEDPHV
ncbi:MAG TPA: LysR family transcriptional regulator [Bacteriovoracaceae bacterium]|nr:LysR family transcriptional regulator [Bacteriovoracaceae bacterium]